jgi:hypothetical protein
VADGTSNKSFVFRPLSDYKSNVLTDDNISREEDIPSEIVSMYRVKVMC